MVLYFKSICTYDNVIFLLLALSHISWICEHFIMFQLFIHKDILVIELLYIFILL